MTIATNHMARLASHMTTSTNHMTTLASHMTILASHITILASHMTTVTSHMIILAFSNHLNFLIHCTVWTKTLCSFYICTAFCQFLWKKEKKQGSSCACKAHFLNCALLVSPFSAHHRAKNEVSAQMNRLRLSAVNASVMRFRIDRVCRR